MNTDERTINLRNKMASVAKKLVIVFDISLVFFALFAIAFFSITIIGIDEFSVRFAFQIATLALSSTLGFLVLFALRLAFSDVAKGCSPFTARQSRILFAIAIMLLVAVILEALASVTAPTIAADTAVSINTSDVHSGTTVMRFNATMFFSSIGCFCLSYIFRYGSLLQWLYDETI